eukprot:m.266272 g.266272  ORF g.266272 m.266272 type:complete len:81 (+) comp64856_c0_seq1:68-310(+)
MQYNNYDDGLYYHIVVLFLVLVLALVNGSRFLAFLFLVSFLLLAGILLFFFRRFIMYHSVISSDSLRTSSFMCSLLFCSP